MKEAMAELKKNVELLVHNAMEEHIAKFLKSGTFDEIVNLYRLPTVILAFTNCRKKVKSQYPEVDVTKGCTIFPPNFDFKFVAVEEKVAEVKGTEEEGNQPPPPVEVHTIPLEEGQPTHLEAG
ncbi:hypothetical protein SLEP1_g57478 [Rubroshorea leprosula]|uniref:Uncharacterized protein n=1 Tax=Rubroshorea leprosula TaxID=152421 RepID=A0AAV5MLD2_9ROSI|nr:hypothetical protein SLEP1_g57478 [Rubroshorea leprosula]